MQKDDNLKADTQHHDDSLNQTNVDYKCDDKMLPNVKCTNMLADNDDNNTVCDDFNSTTSVFDYAKCFEKSKINVKPSDKLQHNDNCFDKSVTYDTRLLDRMISDGTYVETHDDTSNDSVDLECNDIMLPPCKPLIHDKNCYDDENNKDDDDDKDAKCVDKYSYTHVNNNLPGMNENDIKVFGGLCKDDNCSSLSDFHDVCITNLDDMDDTVVNTHTRKKHDNVDICSIKINNDSKCADELQIDDEYHKVSYNRDTCKNEEKIDDACTNLLDFDHKLGDKTNEFGENCDKICKDVNFDMHILKSTVLLLGDDRLDDIYFPNERTEFLSEPVISDEIFIFENKTNDDDNRDGNTATTETHTETDRDTDVSNFCFRLSPHIIDVDHNEQNDMDIETSDEDVESLTGSDTDDETGNNHVGDDANSHDSSIETDVSNDNDNVNSNKNDRHISCIALNVGGIESKLIHPEFHKYLSRYDIVCLSETHLSDTDEVNISGFTTFYKNRLKFKKKSGGLLILIKDELTNHLTIYENVLYKEKVDPSLLRYYEFVQHDISKNILLFKLHDHQLENDIIFGSVYIEPITSKYFNRNVYIDIQNTLGYFDSDHICLLGDFNSRTGTLDELLDANEFVDALSENTATPFDVPTRCSQDPTRNQMGTELIELCRTNGYVIINGRMSQDAGIGKVTCKNVSVVDYAITSLPLLPSVHYFKVHDFDEIYSDVHSAIEIELKVSFKRDDIETDRGRTENDNINLESLYIKWDSKKRNEYIEALDDDVITQISQELDNLEVIPNVNKDNINAIVNQINSVLINGAKETGMARAKRVRTTKKTKRSHKPWYDNSCKIKRKQYTIARNRSMRNRQDVRLKEEAKQKAKEYKKHTRRKDREYRNQLADKLRNTKVNDPKLFHNILNDKNSNQNSKMPTAEQFYDMFKNLNENNSNNNNSNLQNDIQHNDPILNDKITNAEVMKCIKRLKNDKARGVDDIANEFLKASSGKMIDIYTRLFNIVLNTGIIPDNWAVGIIKPIYKKKGSPEDPNNYRGITILSCFSKLFTSVLNERLKHFLECNNLLGNEQTGFRNGYSTLDNLFTLYGMVDILLFRKKRLHCAFLDLEKAFDKINRTFLWEKMIALGIKGKLINVIHNLYSEAKSSVETSKQRSSFFQSNIGVRQGENLSPLLFAIFLNDLKSYLEIDMNHIHTLENEARNAGLCENDVNILIKLFILLYADDSVVFSDTVNGLQKSLDCVKRYCDRFDLVLNAKKCKVLIFSRGKIRNIPKFKIGMEDIEVVTSFTYLGIKLNYNNRTAVAQQDLFERATRSMFSLLKKSKKHGLPTDLTLELFDSMVAPVLLYGCEIWGHEQNACIERLQLKFYKFLLKLRQTTPSYMVYGETGKYPLDITIKSRLLMFWFNLAYTTTQKLSSLLYKFLLKLYEQNIYQNSYIKFVKTTLDQLGLTYIWTNQTTQTITVSGDWLKEKLKRSLKDQFIQTFYAHIDNDAIFTNYRMFKTTFEKEKYLAILPNQYAITLAKFRTTNNYSPVNRLRFTQTLRTDRQCTKCDLHEVGDEFHYIFICPYFVQLRQQYLPTNLLNRPNTITYEKIMTSKEKTTLIKLAKFITNIEKYLQDR